MAPGDCSPLTPIQAAAPAAIASAASTNAIASERPKRLCDNRTSTLASLEAITSPIYPLFEHPQKLSDPKGYDSTRHDIGWQECGII